MKQKLLFVGVLLTICSCRTGAIKPTDPGKKIETVKPDYGILPESYRTRSGMRPLKWSCFPIEDVEVKYRSWRASDGMGRYDVIVTMCDFEIWVNSKPFQNVYSGRRAKQEVYCNDFKAAWNKLTQGEKHICMDGETLTNGEPEEDKDSKKMLVSWTWDKIKTQKGCYSFWDGYNCVDF
jgi:hypothetical protein